MRDGERHTEGLEASIEDLDAPAAAQDEVEGGQGCGKPSVFCAFTAADCQVTSAKCTNMSHSIEVYEQ